MAKSGEFIGFPPGLLGRKSHRLPLLRNRENWFALYKPPHVLARAHPWFLQCPDLTLGIKAQLTQGKAELQRLGIAEVFFVAGPEYEVGGPVIYGKNKAASDRLRNGLGSEQFKFTFLGVSAGKWNQQNCQCHLPVAWHNRETRVVISKKTGKKSSTFFDKLAENPPLTLWRATVRNPRLHQLRIHAYESGLPVLGDELYRANQADPGSATVNSVSRAIRGFGGLALFLREVQLPLPMEENRPVVADLPRGFSDLLRKTGFAIG